MNALVFFVWMRIVDNQTKENETNRQLRNVVLEKDATNPKRRNKYVTEEISQVLLLHELIAKQTMLCFRYMHVENDMLEKPIMVGIMKRKRGRPRIRWMDEIKDITKLTMDELIEATRHNIGWRQLITVFTRSHTI